MPLLLTVTAVRLLIGHQQTHISHLEAEVEQLSDLNVIQEKANGDLRGVTEQLNWTLNVIMSYEKFPVKMFCQGHSESEWENEFVCVCEMHLSSNCTSVTSSLCHWPQIQLCRRFSNPAGCQPCKDDWIAFHNKCYLFYEEKAPWKTWGESRRYCREKDADLVTIDSLREQVTPHEVDISTGCGLAVSGGQICVDLLASTHRNSSAVTPSTTMTPSMDTGWGCNKIVRSSGCGWMEETTLWGRSDFYDSSELYCDIVIPS